MYFHFISFVSQNLVDFFGKLTVSAMPFIHQYDPKLSCIQHARIFTVTVTDNKYPLFVVPRKRDGGISTFLIIIIIILVFIQQELAVCPRINTYLQIVPFLFRSILYVRSYRKNTTRLHIQRNDVNRSLFGYRLPPPGIACRSKSQTNC